VARRQAPCKSLRNGRRVSTNPFLQRHPSRLTEESCHLAAEGPKRPEEKLKSKKKLRTCRPSSTWYGSSSGASSGGWTVPEPRHAKFDARNTSVSGKTPPGRRPARGATLRDDAQNHLKRICLLEHFIGGSKSLGVRDPVGLGIGTLGRARARGRLGVDRGKKQGKRESTSNKAVGRLSGRESGTRREKRYRGRDGARRWSGVDKRAGSPTGRARNGSPEARSNVHVPREAD